MIMMVDTIQFALPIQRQQFDTSIVPLLEDSAMRSVDWGQGGDGDAPKTILSTNAHMR